MKDGGPAFPLACDEVVPGPGGPYSVPVAHYGMSLRDWFAGMALQGMIASSQVCDRTDPSQVNHGGWSEQAYLFADAMLAEREKEAK